MVICIDAHAQLSGLWMFASDIATKEETHHFAFVMSSWVLPWVLHFHIFHVTSFFGSLAALVSIKNWYFNCLYTVEVTLAHSRMCLMPREEWRKTARVREGNAAKSVTVVAGETLVGYKPNSNSAGDLVLLESPPSVCVMAAISLSNEDRKLLDWVVKSLATLWGVQLFQVRD